MTAQQQPQAHASNGRSTECQAGNGDFFSSSKHGPRATPRRNGRASLAILDRAESATRPLSPVEEKPDLVAQEEQAPPLTLEAVGQARVLTRRRSPDDPPAWSQLRVLEVNLTRQAIVDAVRPPDNQTLDAAECAQDILEAWLEEMAPRTPLERLLAIQALWAHVRAGRLCGLSARSEGRAFEALDPAADRALRTASRILKALADLQERNRANELGSADARPGAAPVHSD